MPSVNEDRQLDVLRPTMIDEGIHGRPYAPAGVDDIVHQHHTFAGDIVGNVVWAN
jgi:hypothetical protein